MKPRLLLTVIAVAALAIAGAAVIILTINQPERPDGLSIQHPIATNTPDEPGCSNVVTVYFKTDEAMREAFPRMESDNRYYNLVQETQAQAYARFKVVFRDQPDLVNLARPEALPASVTFAVDSYTDKQDVLTELRRTYEPADVADPCELTSRLPVPTAPTRPTR